DVPDALRPLLESALATDPTDRFADAGAMLTAIAPVVSEHAATLTAADIAAHLRRLFPEGWEPTPTQSLVAEITPVTRLEPQTYATRLTSISPLESVPGSSAALSSSETSSASLSGAARSGSVAAAPVSAVRRVLPMVGLVAAAAGITFVLTRPGEP